MEASLGGAEGFGLKCTKINDLYKMQALPLSALRADISSIIDQVQQGETVRILRHGKPVADLVPVQDTPVARQPSWKQPFDPVALPPQASLAQAVLHEREAGA